jgi:hypothetical protein
LDAKQAAGSYAAASHTHTAGQVSGLATVATSGSYTDLTNKPTIPAAVTSLPAASITGLATVATSGAYADLSNKPSIPAAYSLPVATSAVLGGVKQGSNVTIGVDGTVSVAAPVTTLAAGAITGLATVATSGAYADLSGKPTLFSGLYADLTSVPDSFVPSAHNQAWSTVTATPTTLSGYGITDAVGSSDSRLTDSRTPASHVHGNLTNAGAIGSTSGKIVVTTASGVLTTAATIAAASQVSGLATVATSGLASDLSGTLADARLSATVTTALTDARTPTSHASSHASGGADALTLAASQITSGTLADSLLSANIATYATLAPVGNSSSSVIDIYPRGEQSVQATAITSGTLWITFFTPQTTLTVSSITMASTQTAGATLTLARMGLYTFNETTATLVARCASDTTLFTSTITAYTRAFNTTGGYPATYTLNAGTRYGVGVIVVGTTMPSLGLRAVNVALASLTPRMSGTLTSQSDLPASATITTSQQSQPFARLS